MNDYEGQQKKKKVTSLFQSERRYTRSGSITTTAIDTEDDIRKSRIMNLPNYKKQTLQCRLDFVVIFQTIEIQRLSLQIESLRVRLLDSERQIFNYKNYEIQIKQLTERCFEFENERYKFEDSLAKINSVCKYMEKEIDGIREKKESLEDEIKDKDDIIFRLRQSLIIEKKNREELQAQKGRAEDSLREKQKQFAKSLREIQKQGLMTKNDLNKNQENLNKLLKKYQQEIKDLQKENSSLRNIYDAIENQSKKMEAKYEDFEEEIYRLNESLKQKHLQLEQNQKEYKERIEELEIKYEEECEEKCKKIEEYQGELNDWKNSAYRMEEQIHKYESKIAQFQQQVERYEMLLNEAGDEIDRLNTIIKDKIKYLQAWQDRFREMEQKHLIVEDNLKNQMVRYNTAQEQINKLSYTLRHKNEAIQKMQKTFENHNKIVKQKAHEMEDYKTQLHNLKKQNESEKEDMQRKNMENNQLKEQLNKRTVESNKIFENLNKIQGQLKQKKNTIQSLQNQLTKKETQIKGLKDSLEQKNRSLEDLRLQKVQAEDELARLKSIEERLRSEEEKKNNYLSELKRVNAKLKDYEKTINERNNKINNLQNQIFRYKEYEKITVKKIKDYEQRLQIIQACRKELNSLQNKNNYLEEEIKNMNSVIVQRSCELKNLKEMVFNYQKINKEYRMIETKLQDQIELNLKLNIEIKTWREKYHKLEDQNDQLDSQLIKTKNEKDNVKKELNSLEKVIQINAEELKRIQNQLMDLKQEIAVRKEQEKKLNNKIKQGDKRYKAIESQMEKQKLKNQKEKSQAQKVFDKKLKDLQNEIKLEREQKQKLNLLKQKIAKEKEKGNQAHETQLKQIKQTLKKTEIEKQTFFRTTKQLEKKLINLEYEITRLNDLINEMQKELKISVGNEEKALQKNQQYQNIIRSSMDKFNQISRQKQDLSIEIAELNEAIKEKQKIISEMIKEIDNLKRQILEQENAICMHQEKQLKCQNQIISLKFQSENINRGFNNLISRINRNEALIEKVKSYMKILISNFKTRNDEYLQLEAKSLSYQQKLIKQLQEIEQISYRQSEEIIRLETLNKILNIEIGDNKIKYSTLSGPKDRYATVEQTTNMKESIAMTGEINLVSKKSRSRTTKIDEQDFDQIQNVEKNDMTKSPKNVQSLKSSKNRIYFDNLVSKNN